METFDKLALVGQQMGLEPAEERDAVPVNGPAPCGHAPVDLQRIFGKDPTRGPLPPKANSLGVSYAALPGGRQMPMLKTLLTSACERDCFYCPFRARRNFRRATFKPEEMAQAFAQMHQAGTVEGLFLSSGIAAGGIRTQDKLLDTVEILRRKHEFRGYVHLKLMPGAERDQVWRAMQLSNRVSINLEAPNSTRLTGLAPHKIFLEELLQPLRWVDEIRRTQPPLGTVTGRWPSMVTQFVVGAVGESDRELLTTSEYVMRQLRLQRVYFSGFHPIENTPLENTAPTNPWREHRLYQASFLLRDYGFALDDLPLNTEGLLPLDADPKLAWANAHLRATPIELNRADRPTLLRVPGLGPKSVETILRARRTAKLTDVRDLRQLGINASRAAPFILLNGRRPAVQLGF